MNTDSGGCARKRTAMSVTLTAVKRVQSSPNLLTSGQEPHSPDSAKGFRSVRPNLQDKKSPTQAPLPPPRKGSFHRSSNNYQQQAPMSDYIVSPAGAQTFTNKGSVLYSAKSSTSMRQMTTNAQMSSSNLSTKAEHLHPERKQDSKERRISTLKLILKEFSSNRSPSNTLQKSNSTSALEHSRNLLANNLTPEKHTASLSVDIAPRLDNKAEEKAKYHGQPATMSPDTVKGSASHSGQKQATTTWSKESHVVY